MRGSELLDKMDLVDSAYIKAADIAPKSKKRGWIRLGTIAACLCLVLLGLFMYMTDSSNVFAVKAYALEETADGSIGLREEDLLDQSGVWGGHFDGENFYVNIGLRYEGNNIKSVVFTTEEGFFAKQYIGNLIDGESVSRTYVGADNRLAVYGTEFEISGDTIMLNGETMTDDLLLFWGTQIDNAEELLKEIPKNVEIHATATFYDGKTQDVTIPINLSGTGVGSYRTSEEEQRKIDEIDDYYESIPLENCELVEESVETVTDVYECHVGTTVAYIRDFDKMEFDEYGINRGGFLTDLGTKDVYIPVIRREDDGTFTGMLYRVPESLGYNG